MVAVAVTSLLFGPVMVRDLGMLALATPVPLLLLLPGAAGVSIAVAAVNSAGALFLPDPARALVSRVLWVVLWSLLAIAGVNASYAVGNGVGWQPAVRNVLLYAALGLFVVCLGHADLAWLPILVYTLASMIFGSAAAGARSYSWWAVVLARDVSGWQAVTVGATFAAAVACYARWGSKPRRRAPH
jgi:hypothetical protein